MTVTELIAASFAVPLITLIVVIAMQAVRTRQGEIMSHASCGRPGKYDCSADERLDEILMEEDNGEGSVDLPVGWFATVDLDPTVDAELINHYGSRWLIARMSDQGFFRTLVFPTEPERAAIERALHAELELDREEEG